jgi:hypothetical protein
VGAGDLAHLFGPFHAGEGRELLEGLAQQRYVKSHRNLFRSPCSGPHPGTPYRPILEHVHAFTRAVSVGNPRECLQAQREDQEMAEGCKRLIKHCIVCWTYLYRSQKLAEIDEPAKREQLLQAMAHGSAAALGGT